MSHRTSRRHVLLLAALLPGCALPGRQEIDLPPEVSIIGLRPVQLGLLEQALELELRFVNPNPAPIEVEGLRYELTLGEGRLGRGASDAHFTVPRLGEAVVPVRLYVQTTDLIGRAGALGVRPDLAYRLAGELFTESGTLAFDREGVVELPQTPRS
jgi:hypothetical protein